MIEKQLLTYDQNDPSASAHLDRDQKWLAREIQRRCAIPPQEIECHVGVSERVYAIVHVRGLRFARSTDGKIARVFTPAEIEAGAPQLLAFRQEEWARKNEPPTSMTPSHRSPRGKPRER